MGGKVACKSKIVYKTLNPLWDEWFQIPVDDPYVPLQIKVNDACDCTYTGRDVRYLQDMSEFAVGQNRCQSVTSL